MGRIDERAIQSLTPGKKIGKSCANSSRDFPGTLLGTPERTESRRDDDKNIICTLEGAGEGGKLGENCAKTIILFFFGIP